MGIFKSKPGGSFLGNMVRGVASKFTGGILGGGAMLNASLGKQQAAQDEIDRATMLAKGVAMAAAGGVIGDNPKVQKLIASGIWEKYKYFIIGGAVAIIGTIIYLATKKKKYGKYR